MSKYEVSHAKHRMSMGSSHSLPMLSPQAFPRALELRQMALIHDDLPRYLLAPEVAALLHYVPNWSRHALINLMWNCGCRVNEALALRRRDFRLNVDVPYVVVRTAKQRRSGPGRPAKGKSANRIIPLTDMLFVDELRRLFASTEEEVEIGTNGAKSPLPIWNVSARTVRNWINAAVQLAEQDEVRFSLHISPHTFRHSYAVHMLYQGTQLKVLQGLMGHEKLESTEAYTRIFALDIVAERQVQFSMPSQDAVEMVRGVASKNLLSNYD